MSEAIAKATKELTAAGVISPAVDAELLAGHLLGCSKSEIIKLSLSGKDLNDHEEISFFELVARRAKREPLQHITGIAHFRNLELKVGPGVFVPRPETELLVDYSLELVSGIEKPAIADLCSGSGAIAISLATEIQGSSVFAVEKSAEAFDYLTSNFAAYGLDVDFTCLGDLADELADKFEYFDLVVSNPPYIPEGAVPIYEEVRLFDPGLALYGGSDGLDVVRAISTRALHLLKPAGFIVLEHSENQAAAIGELLLADGWLNVASRQDLTGRDRMTSAQKPSR